MSSKEDEETDKPQLMFRTPYRLMVEAPSNLSGGASYSLDQCACELHPKTMSELAADPTSKLFDGDFVVIKGKTQSKIVVRVYKNANCEEGAVYVNDECRRNLRVKLSDMVSVHPLENAPMIQELELAPVKESIEGISGNITKTFLYDPSLYDVATRTPLPDQQNQYDPPFLHSNRKLSWDQSQNPYSSWPRVRVLRIDLIHFFSLVVISLTLKPRNQYLFESALQLLIVLEHSGSYRRTTHSRTTCDARCLVQGN